MPDLNQFSALQFQIYPLELFILFVGFCFGLAIGRLKDRRLNQQQQSQSYSEQTSIRAQNLKQQNSVDNSILAYSLSSGQSFLKNNKRLKLFKGHLYQYFSFQFGQNQQTQENQFEISKGGITKLKKDGEWIKLYDKGITVPKQGKHYFQVYVVKNQYFIKRQANQRSSNIAVSRTDLIAGFFVINKQDNLSKKVQEINKQSIKQSNNIVGIIAYSFNGRIYNNSQLRTEEKLIKKNKALTILINRDEGYIAYEVESQTIGYSILPKNQVQMIPFVQMYAIGSSVIISS